MEPTPDSTTRARTLAAGAVGNVLEWYDFTLFGFVAPIISTQIFPAEDRVAALLNTFGVFALGFVVRPLGAILFGSVGDRYGRRRALGLSVVMMAIPSFLIGLLPTYAAIGLAALLLLTLVRVLQGLSVGGEYTGSMSFLVEHAAPDRRGFAGSWTNFGGCLGSLLGSGLFAAISALATPEQMAAWGWRLPFLLSALSGPLAWWLRFGVAESPSFEALVKEGNVAAAPVREVLRHEKTAMLQTIGIALMQSIGYYLPWVWLVTWLSRINQPPLSLSEALAVNTLGMSAVVVLTPLCGWLSDHIGRKLVFVTATLLLIVFTYPAFVVMGQGTFAAALLGQGVFALSSSLIQGSTPVMFAELFPTRTRFSGMGLSYNLTQALLGGTTPLVATWLVEATGDVRAPAWYLIAAAVVSTVVALRLPQRRY